MTYHQIKLMKQRQTKRDERKRQMVEDILRLIADPPGVRPNEIVKFTGLEPKPEDLN